MALQIEQQTRDIGVVRTTLGAERTRVIVRPGDAFRFVDDTGQPLARAPRMRVRRIDNNLIVDGLPDGRVLELNNFFGACRPGAECTLSLQGVGLPGAAAITEESLPTAALADGSFLLYSDNTDATALAALPAAALADSGGPSWLAIGGAAAGVGIAAAAAGGGGSGGGGNAPAEDVTPPGAPVITSGPVLRRAAATVTGEAEAGSRVTVRVDVNGNGTFSDPGDLSFVTTAGADGRWSVNLNGTPQSGTPPAGGLVDGRQYALLVQAADAAQNASPATRSAVTLDGTAPTAPVLAVVAGDDVVNGAERLAGVTVSGTTEAGASVAVAWGATTLTAVAGANGQFSVVFPTAQVPGDGTAAIRATATDAAGNASPVGTRPGSITIDTVAPAAPTIASAAITNLALPVVSGTAEAGSRVTVSIDLAANGGVDVVYAAVAGPTGVWTIDTATAAPVSGSIGAGLADRAGATLTPNTLTVVATDPAGNASPATTGTVSRDSTIPPAPAINPVAGDDIVNAAERPGTVTVTGTLDPIYAGRPVTVVWGASKPATVTGTTWSAVFETGEIPAGEGATTIQATTISLAGVISATGTRTVTIDTTAPAAPTATLSPASDTGTLGDNTTTVAAPTIRVDLNGSGGTAPVAGDTVRLTSGGVTRGTAVLTGADILADFVNVASSALPVGANTLSAVVVDTGGNTSAAGTLTLTIVAAPTAPTAAPDLVAASDSGASSTDNVTNDTTPTFAIGALPAGVTGVRLFVGGVEVAATYDPAGGGLITPNGPLPAPGTPASVTYAYVDGAGAVTAQSPALAVTIDTTAPAPPAAAPDLIAASDTGASDTDNVTSDLTPTFAVGALPADATGMRLLVDGVQVAATYVATGGGQITPDAPLAPSPTARAFSVALVDAAGNVGASGPALPVVVNTAAAPPPTPASAPDLLAASDSGTSNTDNITNATRPVFSIGALPSGVATARLYIDGTLVTSTYSAVAGTLTPTADVPAPSTAQAVTYRYFDALGTESAPSPALTVTLDRTAPTAGSVTFEFRVFDDRGTPGTGDDVAFVHNTVTAGLTDTTPRVVLTVNSLLANDRLQLVRDATVIGVLTSAPGTIDLVESTALPTSGAPPAAASAFYSVGLSDLAGNASTVLDLNGGAIGNDFALRISP